MPLISCQKAEIVEHFSSKREDKNKKSKSQCKLHTDHFFVSSCFSFSSTIDLLQALWQIFTAFVNIASENKTPM